MELLARLHHDHEVVDEQIGRFEECLKSGGRARGGEPNKLHKLLEPLIECLSHHIRFEEVYFYAPLKASGHARPDLMEMLESEHEDLLKTLESLQQLRHQHASSHDETLRAYGFHLIELYREHTEREHRWLFPVLEQLPQRAEGSFDVPARMRSQEAGLPPGELITKEMTLNAVIRRFPTLLHVLHTLQLDSQWFGSDTIEEVAWYHGMQVDNVLGELNRSLPMGQKIL